MRRSFRSRSPAACWRMRRWHCLQSSAMIAIRAAKVAMVAAIALFGTLVAFGNITDYGTNFVFVQHVLSMDTIFPTSSIKYRAVTDPALHRAVYALIIAAE